MAQACGDSTLSELAHMAISKYLQQTVVYEKGVLADIEPEDLHQMRVGLRRLRTALKTFNRAVKIPKAGREPKIANIGHQLGELRDLDVIADILRKDYGPDLPNSEQQLLEPVLSQLFERRQVAFKRVKKLLHGKSYHHTKQTLQKWTLHPTYERLGQLPATMALPDLVGPLVNELWLHPGFLVGAQASPDGFKANTDLDLKATDQLIAKQGPLLHCLRKQFKRVRYTLKLVSNLYQGALDDALDRCSDSQETLGNLQDSMVLQEFIENNITHGKTKMPTLFALLADSRHQAWQQWQIQQDYYLHSSHRQELRLTILQIAGLSTETVDQLATAEKLSSQTGKKNRRHGKTHTKDS